MHVNADQGLDDIDVMDHEIKHHADIRTALLVGREAMALDETRPPEVRFRPEDRRVGLASVIVSDSL